MRVSENILTHTHKIPVVLGFSLVRMPCAVYSVLIGRACPCCLSQFDSPCLVSTLSAELHTLVNISVLSLVILCQLSRIIIWGFSLLVFISEVCLVCHPLWCAWSIFFANVEYEEGRLYKSRAVKLLTVSNQMIKTPKSKSRLHAHIVLPFRNFAKFWFTIFYEPFHFSFQPLGFYSM